jgi:hypothetical protein
MQALSEVIRSACPPLVLVVVFGSLYSASVTIPGVSTSGNAGCPILFAASSRKGWDSTTLNRIARGASAPCPFTTQAAWDIIETNGFAPF